MGKFFTKLNSFTKINIQKGSDISVFYEKNNHKPKEVGSHVNVKFFGDAWSRGVPAAAVNNLDVYIKIGETYITMDGRTFNALVNTISTSWQEYSYTDRSLEEARISFINEILAQNGTDSF